MARTVQADPLQQAGRGGGRAPRVAGALVAGRVLDAPFRV